jgi:plasmid stabilization system protein ParE
VRRLVFAHGAKINVMEIIDYVAEQSGSLAAAEAFAEQLLTKCEQLAALPGTLGLARPELLPDVRSTPFGNYVIFFRYVEDTFEVVNILEGHRDISRYFRNPA